jgi:hypothetical protein
MLTSKCGRKHRLHIIGNSRTRGVLSTLTIVPKQDPQQRPLLFFIQRRHAIEKGLTSAELYALFAVAAKKYLAQPLVEDTIKYQVRLHCV